MKRIYKYPVEQDVTSLPKGAKVIHAGVQHDRICVRAIVDPEEMDFRDGIICVGTGHPIEDSIFPYHSTHMLHKGDLVFHLFIPKYFLHETI